MENWEVVARGGGSDQARFYRGDYDSYFGYDGYDDEEEEDDMKKYNDMDTAILDDFVEYLDANLSPSGEVSSIVADILNVVRHRIKFLADMFKAEYVEEVKP